MSIPLNIYLIIFKDIFLKINDSNKLYNIYFLKVQLKSMGEDSNNGGEGIGLTITFLKI